MKSLLIIFILNITMMNLPTVMVESSSILEKEINKDVKRQAFDILKTKCNVCHEVKNKKRVFTIENMDSYGKKIYKQVFKLKRMPKGEDIKLTDQEYDQLQNWITSLKNN